MKKQILILAFLVLAIFASVNNSYGQLLPDLPGAPGGCPSVIAIACNVAANPLNPIPGTPYDYEVNIPAPVGGTFQYDWFVTTEKNFIAAKTLTTTFDAVGGSHIASIASGVGLSTYHTPGTGDKNKINITWQSFVPSTTAPVFLVIQVKNTLTCLTDNIQVFEIKPQPSFTLDLTNITAAGATAADAYATCVAPIVTATWDQVSGKVIMDYGENYVFYAVTAANFNHSWKPAFKASTSIALGTSTMDVAWAYKAESYDSDGAGPLTATWHTTTLTSGTWVSSDVVNAPSNGAVGTTGECIIVRVHIDHNNEPTLTDNTISFAVDGIMKDPAATLAADYYTNTAFGDLHSSNAVPANCGKIDAWDNDKTTQVISARPTITAVAPSTPFIDKTN